MGGHGVGDRDNMREKTACDLMFQAVNATKYCIDRGVLHSDFTPSQYLGLWRQLAAEVNRLRMWSAI